MTHNVRIDDAGYVLYAAVAEAADKQGIQWMVTGAAGRVLLLEMVYGLPRGKATEDVDFAVMVESWDHYQAIVDQICEDSRFVRDARQRQRILGPEDTYLDLIPFGGVETADQFIHWPPERDFSMNVLGFRDACADAVLVTVNDNLPVPVVSPAGLVLLKIIAWKDRHHSHPGRDAGDIAYVLRHYNRIETEQKLFDDHYDAVEEAGYDIDFAAARVLGRRIGSLASPRTHEQLLSILGNEIQIGMDSDLVSDIAEWLPGYELERVLQVLEQLQTGLNDRQK